VGTTGNGAHTSGVATLFGRGGDVSQKGARICGGSCSSLPCETHERGGGVVLSEFFRGPSPIFPFPAELTIGGGGTRVGRDEGA